MIWRTPAPVLHNPGGRWVVEMDGRGGSLPKMKIKADNLTARASAGPMQEQQPSPPGPGPGEEAAGAVGEFCAITGAGRSAALTALAQSRGDLARAVGLFFDLGAAGLAAQAAQRSRAAGDTAAVSAGAGGHTGEWRSTSVMTASNTYCKLGAPDGGDAGTHICAHAGGVIRASHWSCCGALNQAAPCGGVRSAVAPATLR